MENKEYEDKFKDLEEKGDSDREKVDTLKDRIYVMDQIKNDFGDKLQKKLAGIESKYNYMTATLTIDETNDSLFFFSDDDNSKTGISGLQIITVPEPSSVTLFGLGGLALLLHRRRA